MAKLPLSPTEYVGKKGNYCPACGSEDFEGQEISVVAGEATQSCYCHECGSEWMDTYILTGYMDLEDNRELNKD